MYSIILNYITKYSNVLKYIAYFSIAAFIIYVIYSYFNLIKENELLNKSVIEKDNVIKMLNTDNSFIKSHYENKINDILIENEKYSILKKDIEVKTEKVIKYVNIKNDCDFETFFNELKEVQK